MKNQSVNNTASREFFSFNGGYLIHPGTDADDLLNDAGCWITAASEIVSEMAAGLTDKKSDTYVNQESAGKMLWGAWHLLQMVEGAILQAHKAMPEEAA